MSSSLADNMVVQYAGHSPVTKKEKQEAEENLPYFINAINKVANTMCGKKTTPKRKSSPKTSSAPRLNVRSMF